MTPTIGRASIGLGAVLLIYLGIGWAALFPITVLLSRIATPKSRIINVWPFGLLVFQGLSLVWYVTLWLIGAEGLNISLSKLILVSMVFIGVFFPSSEPFREAADENKVNLATFFGLLCIGILYFIIIFRSQLLINAHLGGGDHSNHVNFAYSFISHVNREALPNPLSLSGYAHSIHFSVALISTTSIQNFDGTVLGLVFRDFAFFDVLTLVAMLQITAATLPRIERKTFAIPALVLVPTLLLVKVPGLLSHFWLSGFSTSLFALFVLIANLRFHMIGESSQRKTLFGLLTFFILMGVYQPFVLVPLPVIAIAFLKRANLADLRTRLILLSISMSMPLFFIVVIFQFSGKTGVFAQTLMREGAFIEPSTLLFFSLIPPIFFFVIFTKMQLEPLLMHTSLLSVILGFWSASYMMGANGKIVYYVAKLIWTGIAVGVFLNTIYVVVLLLPVLVKVRFMLANLITLTVVLASFFFIGVNPFTRFSFPNGFWFVDHINDSELVLSDNTVALNPQDRFSSHLANIALTEVSPVARTFDLLLLSEISTAGLCQASYELKINRILTSKFGKAELLSSGCGRKEQQIIQSRR